MWEEKQVNVVNQVEKNCTVVKHKSLKGQEAERYEVFFHSKSESFNYV